MYLVLDHHGWLRAHAQLLANIKLYAMVMSEVRIWLYACRQYYYYVSIIDAKLHTNSNSKDMKAIVAEIAGLMGKIERLNKRQLWANQQAQAVAAKSRNH